MARLEGKTAFITGAGSGIARAAARLFAQEGAKVAIAEIKPELGRASAEAVRDTGGDAFFVETDVTKEDSVKSAIQQTVARFGKLDILYNCAGGSIAQDRRVTDVDMMVWQHTISFDLLGMFLCCRHGIPELIKAGGGAVVNMSSVAALRGSFPGHVYVAAKGGIIALTKSLAGEYAKDRIRVNAIAPGLVKTGRVLDRMGDPGDPNTGTPQAQAIKGQLRKYPFSVGDPEDIARIALFLASDEARMITGVTLPADGGLSTY
ncbi:MAG TPA: SDR family oxidoreductase [Candidatus Binataceae bacterium]|nr:SDR family oxidoreductase [Candidatus Binataceae bacterium]